MPASCAMLTAFAMAPPLCGTITSISTRRLINAWTSPICRVSDRIVGEHGNARVVRHVDGFRHGAAVMRNDHEYIHAAADQRLDIADLPGVRSDRRRARECPRRAPC